MARARIETAGGEDGMDAGFLGVGNMGLPMAGKLMDAGHALTVFDIREEAMAPLLARQARRAVSPRDIADRCETGWRRARR
jgi:3-hydroxyisobutyrate dehydrogenase-like beta-hydroxyacid dehydrogenase